MKADIYRCNSCGREEPDTYAVPGWIVITGGNNLRVEGGRERGGSGGAETYKYMSSGAMKRLDFCSPQCLLSFLFLDDNYFNDSSIKSLNEKLKSMRNKDNSAALKRITTDIKEFVSHTEVPGCKATDVQYEIMRNRAELGFRDNSLSDQELLLIKAHTFVSRLNKEYISEDLETRGYVFDLSSDGTTVLVTLDNNVVWSSESDEELCLRYIQKSIEAITKKIGSVSEHLDNDLL